MRIHAFRGTFAAVPAAGFRWRRRSRLVSSGIGPGRGLVGDPTASCRIAHAAFVAGLRSLPNIVVTPGGRSRFEDTVVLDEIVTAERGLGGGADPAGEQCVEDGVGLSALPVSAAGLGMGVLSGRRNSHRPATHRIR
jgi:hypothetical protein